MADLAHLESPKSISRKIWMMENSWNFHCSQYTISKNDFFFRQIIFAPLYLANYCLCFGKICVFAKFFSKTVGNKLSVISTLCSTTTKAVFFMFVNGEKIHFAKRIIFRECISGHVFTHYIECNQENDFVMQRNAYSNTQ